MNKMTTTNLPSAVFSAEQVRENEQAAAQQAGIPMYQLMQLAGAAVFSLITQLFPKAGRLVVVTGKGNNAGDGYIVAGLALEIGWQVDVMYMPNAEQVYADAERAKQAFVDLGGKVQAFDPNLLRQADVLVDAVLGTGANKPLLPAWSTIIQQINQLPILTISIDIPSGLQANTGAVLGQAVNADHTVTFIALKSGLLTAQATNYRGKLHFAGLGIDDIFVNQNSPRYHLADWNVLRKKLKPRAKSSYKNNFGHVVCVGGDKGMAGAIKMAATACLRTGAGLVTVLTHPDNVLPVAIGNPELMVHGMNELDDSTVKLIDQADVILIGPGGGRTGWIDTVMEYVTKRALPMVLDADALYWLADHPRMNKQWILTPHVGEAARLLAKDKPSIECDRYVSNTELINKYSGVSILKGAGSIISSEQQTHICLAGNPGMATAGMGDVLAGITAGLLAQARSLNLNLFEVAELAACLHATAGDLAAIDGERGMIATDVIATIRRLVN